MRVGPYELDAPLGAGGMGEVYRATDTRVGRQVAIKLLPKQLAGDPDFKRRFDQEACLAAAINHPNIMGVFDVGLDADPPYIVEELIPGESLRAIVNKGSLAVRKTLDIAAQLADGLAAAHAAGIVHRDLKPENVMLTPEGRVKILDFGVARVERPDSQATITAAGAVVGTASYMSPEQARGQPADYRSDQFSFGLVLYELLSGKKAFERDSAVQTMAAIVETDPPPLERTVPVQLRWIMERCLAKDKAERYESTRDLARDLRALRDHYSELSGPQAAVAGSKRRLKWIVPVAFAVAGALVALAALALLTREAGVDLASYRHIPFATALAEQSFPSWSPDGKSIAYAGSAEGGRQVYVQSLDSPLPFQVTKAPISLALTPFWSPDSRDVYFNASESGKENSYGLWRVSAAGGEPALVQAGVQRASLSPDGRTLACLRLHNRGFGVFIASPPDAPLKPYEPAPFQASGYANRPAIAFAPDGRKILVTLNRNSQGEEAWLLPWPPAPSRRVLEDLRTYRGTPQCSWLPDSRHVVCAATDVPGAPNRLIVADIETGWFRPVLSESRPAWAPSIAPAGDKLVYQSGLSHFDVVEAPLDGAPVRTLLGSFRDELMPAFSPVSRALVYVTDRRGGLEVWVESLAERWARPLLTRSDFPSDAFQFFMTPVFSPDAQRIATVVMSRAGAHLWVAAAGGSAPVRVTSGGHGEVAPTWSPDGHWLAYVVFGQGPPSIAKVRAGASQPPVPLVAATMETIPEWSPTGEWIACSTPGKPGITLVSPDGKNTKVLPGEYAPYAWARDGKTIYQVRGAEKVTLVAIDVASGKERLVRDLGDLRPESNLNPGARVTLAPDGKSIAYAVMRTREELWILEGIRTPRRWFARLGF